MEETLLAKVAGDMFRISLKPGDRTGYHYHHTLETLVVLQGAVIVKLCEVPELAADELLSYTEEQCEKDRLFYNDEANAKDVKLIAGESLQIPVAARHRIVDDTYPGVGSVVLSIRNNKLPAYWIG